MNANKKTSGFQSFTFRFESLHLHKTAGIVLSDCCVWPLQDSVILTWTMSNDLPVLTSLTEHSTVSTFCVYDINIHTLCTVTLAGVRKSGKLHWKIEDTQIKMDLSQKHRRCQPHAPGYCVPGGAVVEVRLIWRGFISKTELSVLLALRVMQPLEN